VSRLLKTALAAWALGISLTLMASDEDARNLLKQANAEFKEQDYNSAAKTALDAEHMADSPQVKAMAVSFAVQSYRKLGFSYREFENIEKLLNNYPSYCDFDALVKREFEIADDCLAGHRDPAYYSLRWIPWLVDEDRSVEIYEKAIAHAPYSKQAPDAKLRAAIRMLETGKDFEKPLAVLRGIIKDYPDTPEAKSAMLHLGVALANLAKYGDGDGAYNREAIQVLNEFKLKYPEAQEINYVNILIAETRDIQAKRLLDTADFYRKNERPEAAQRYLGELIRLYPDSSSSDNAERMLTDMDKTYIPLPIRPTPAPTVMTYAAYPIPPSGGDLMIAPQDSDGKYLLPIRDLGLGKKTAGKPEEKTVEETVEKTAEKTGEK